MLVIVLSACRTAGPTISLAQVADVPRTRVQIYLPERQIGVDWVNASLDGFGRMTFGVIGALASAAKNRQRERLATELAGLLRAQTQDVDQQTLLWNALERAIRGVYWLKAVAVERKPIPLEDVAEEDVLNNALLRIAGEVLLSADCKTLNVQSALGFYEKDGAGRPISSVAVYYRSGPIGNMENEKALARWAENGAQAYREALQEGSAENARLVWLALLCMGGMRCAPVTGHHLRFHFAERHAGTIGVEEGFVDEDGTIMEESAFRIIFRTRDGSIYSIPRSSIVRQTGHGPLPAFVPRPRSPLPSTVSGKSPGDAPLSAPAPLPIQPTPAPPKPSPGNPGEAVPLRTAAPSLNP